MKVSDARKLLDKVLEKHGDVEVYFDCPHCKQAFTPAFIETKAVVLNASPK